MRVLAARFATWAAADRVLAELRRRFDLGDTDVSVAPMATADQPEGSVHLLAGRFRESRLEQVRRIVEAGGGAIVADVDEGWTRPRNTTQGQGSRPGWQRQTTGGSFG